MGPDLCRSDISVTDIVVKTPALFVALVVFCRIVRYERHYGRWKSRVAPERGDRLSQYSTGLMPDRVLEPRRGSQRHRLSSRAPTVTRHRSCRIQVASRTSLALQRQHSRAESARHLGRTRGRVRPERSISRYRPLRSRVSHPDANPPRRTPRPTRPGVVAGSAPLCKATPGRVIRFANQWISMDLRGERRLTRAGHRPLWLHASVETLLGELASLVGELNPTSDGDFHTRANRPSPEPEYPGSRGNLRTR